MRGWLKASLSNIPSPDLFRVGVIDHYDYDKIGEEKDSDVVPLRPDIHEHLHKWRKEFNIPLRIAHLAYKAVYDKVTRKDMDDQIAGINQID